MVRACAPRTGARARAARIGPAAARHAPSGSAAGPAAPLVGDLLPHLVKPNRELLIRLMASMGEKDTIVRYPQLIESLGAAARETDQLGREPHRAPGNHLPFRLPALGEGGPG